MEIQIDWKSCIICQQQTPESLKCPLDSPRTEDRSQSYVNFIRNVVEFRAIDALPCETDIGSDVTADTLIANHAS